MPAAALLSVLALASPHGWTLAHARHVLTAHTYTIVDTSQPDQPRYELKLSAGALHRSFVYDGDALDTLTNTKVSVHFRFQRPGRIVGFGGPAADTSQPSFPIRAAFYYEREGYGDPTVEQIRRDLEYIRDTHASKPAYLKVDGRFVVYVYGDPRDGCDMAARWRAANTVGAYVVLKAFAGFRDCAAQPDAWHQYSAALPEYELLPDSFMIAPGFDERSEAEPRLARDVSRWRTDVGDMLASSARWQLVLSFNEWPEGTAVESAREWATPSGYGAYLDTLHELLP